MKKILCILIFVATCLAQDAPSGRIDATATLNQQITDKGFVVSFAAHPPKDLTQCHFWFGDGFESSECKTQHMYSKPGLYRIHVRMASADGRQQASDDLYMELKMPVHFLTQQEIGQLKGQ